MKDAKSVFGIFKLKVDAEKAVDMLRQAQFRSLDISVLMPQMGDTERFAHKKDTKAPEGATTGAVTGAVVGSGLGWLAGIGALAIPGVGPFIAAGPIVAAIAGAGAGGALGGVTGALIGLGIPEYEAKRYEGFVKDGGILLSVHTDDSEWREKAKNILKSAGAEDISSTDEVEAGGPDRKEKDHDALDSRFNLNADKGRHSSYDSSFLE